MFSNISHRLTPFIIAAILCSASAHAQEETPQLGLFWESDLPGYHSTPLPLTVPEKYRNFRGMLIEENTVSEIYPLVLSIFFDQGQATLPDRYVRFQVPADPQLSAFTDSTIPGGTLQKYHHLLNIIGYRMRQYPEAVISLAGCNSKQVALGETRVLSSQRATSVSDYLIRTWGIDPSRIKLLPPRDLPAHPSDNRDLRGIEENRRVDIITDEYRIARPISQRDYRRTPQPDYVMFKMRNGVSDGLISRREIEITWNGIPWLTMKGLGISTKESPEFDWWKGDSSYTFPDKELPYRAQLVLYLRDGRELRSNAVEIPVIIITDEVKRRDRLFDRIILRYSINLFAYKAGKLNGFNERLLREYLYPSIDTNSQIEVVGHTDILEGSLDLSKRRAMAVANSIRRSLKVSGYNKLEAHWVGEESPLYPNDLPEGRAYNRTTTIVVVTPNMSMEKQR